MGFRAWILWSLVLLVPTSYASTICQAQDQDTSRIAVAGGSITEVIYGLGMQDRLVAVDRTSNYPMAATQLPSIGYVRAVSAEGLLALNPSMILGEDDIGPAEVVQQIRAAGVPVHIVPEDHSVEGIFAKVDCVARLIGAPADAVSTLYANMMTNAERLKQRSEQQAQTRVAVLLSLADGVPTGGGAETSAHGVVAMAGAHNVFAEFSGWKPISLEAMAQSNPDFIVMPQRGVDAAGGIEAVRSHPSVRLTNAGRNGRVLPVDGMSLLGFGPRTLAVAVELGQRFGTIAGSQPEAI